VSGNLREPLDPHSSEAYSLRNPMLVP
jgi:hypothetical protein